MVLSCAQKKAAVKHILEVVFDQAVDSLLHQSFALNSIDSPIDLVALSDNDLDRFDYHTDDGSSKSLPPADIGLLKAFKLYVVFRNSSTNPINDTSWLSITADDFNTFCAHSDGEFYAATFGHQPCPTSNQWHQVSANPKKTSDQPTPEAKSSILQHPLPSGAPKPGSPPHHYPPCPPPAPAPQHTIHQHDVDSFIACLHGICGGSSLSDTDVSDYATVIHCEKSSCCEELT